MEITLLYFDGCPNWKVADQRLQLLAAEHRELTVIHQLVETPEQAIDVGFFGSPSLQLNGADLFAEPDSQVGLACRRYNTPDGYEGAPTLSQLRAALAVE
ncbi:putative alkylmercury lyase [marine actinobacterium PHSC20C1]|nr:putative alkylmercury lyase [marine actinobacterium PHSC20C1]